MAKSQTEYVSFFMFKPITVLVFSLTFIALLLYIPLKLMNLRNTQKPAFNRVVVAKPTSEEKIFPDLCSGITWGKSNIGNYILLTGHTYTPNSDEIQKLGQDTQQYYYIIASDVSRIVTNDCVDYYEKWFKKYDWNEDIIAGGPTGDAYGFLKNGRRFLISIYTLSRGSSQNEIVLEHN